ncbi:MAG: 5-oxoprolinase subunit PxpB [Saprospiraceae bacterium]
MIPAILPYGRRHLLLRWEDRIAPLINDWVHAYSRELTQWSEIIECVPAYASLLIEVRAKKVSLPELAARIAAASITLPAGDQFPGRLHTIPVYYGGQAGPDLDKVSRLTGLSTAEVISLHQSVDYRVYQLGFLPGFAFLGLLPPALEVPRRATPRVRVSAGSVGLAGRQTGIYPAASPGGWQLIGRTELMLFRPDKEGREAFLLHPGDRVRFVAASG